ncbi:hypothetical protein [Roseovarius sp. SYSU LYC5161]
MDVEAVTLVSRIIFAVAAFDMKGGKPTFAALIKNGSRLQKRDF